MILDFQRFQFLTEAVRENSVAESAQIVLVIRVSTFFPVLDGYILQNSLTALQDVATVQLLPCSVGHDMIGIALPVDYVKTAVIMYIVESVCPFVVALEHYQNFDIHRITVHIAPVI